MGWKIKLGVLFTLQFGLAAGLFHYSRTDHLINEGTSSDFWYAALRVSPAGFTNLPSGVYQTQGEWFVYYQQGFHGQFLYRVPREVALADFPEVVARLEKAKPDEVHLYILQAFQDWKRQDPTHTDAELLLRLRADYRLKHFQRNDAQWKGDETDWKTYFAQEQEAFEDRYSRIQRYWLNVVCEFAYLSFLIFFALWPWLRSKSRAWWAIHLGALPFLFFLPYYLGYATFCFTSAGPVGGVLYPHLLVVFRDSPIPWSAWDRAVFRNMPHPLSDLSQTTGPMLSLSGGGGIGPVGTLLIGSLICAAIALFPYAIRLGKLISTGVQTPRPANADRDPEQP